MEKNKKKLDELTKAKLIYSGELGLFAILFIVLAILVFTGVYQLSERRQSIFTWLTLVGGGIIVGDLIWLCLSKKRQKKNSWLDKLLPLPLPATLVCMDLYALINPGQPYLYYQIMMGGAFAYIGVLYSFEAIFHFYHPVPAILAAAEEENSAVTETSPVPSSSTSVQDQSETKAKEDDSSSPKTDGQ